MNSVHRNGCHDRKPFREALVVQDGYYLDGYSRVDRIKQIPFRMSMECKYTKTELGQTDKGCNGCKWRLLPVLA